MRRCGSRGSFGLNNEQYGNLEAWFGYAFAAGSLFFGVLADRLPLRWLYAVVVLLWSCVGLCRPDLPSRILQLLICRTLLGFFEGGHWPCAIKATRLLLDARDRSLGNSVLQSGTSIGAIITPLLMRALMTPEVGSWRGAFQVIGAIGLGWIVLWLLPGQEGRPASPRPRTAAAGRGRCGQLLAASSSAAACWSSSPSSPASTPPGRSCAPGCRNSSRKAAAGPRSHALYFNSAWFVATDVGCLGAGALAVWLARRGMPVTRARLHRLRRLRAARAPPAPSLRCSTAAGPLMAVLHARRRGRARGSFPFTMPSPRTFPGSRQGRITGIASVAAWILPAQAQRGFGWLADRTGSFNTGSDRSPPFCRCSPRSSWLSAGERPKPPIASS